MRKPFVVLILVAALGGCDSSPRLAPLGEGPAAPPGTVTVRDAVDGLEVGHRLMAAGEYDLALRAYLRAAGEQGASVDVLSALGSVNLRLGRLGQAEQLLRQAVDKDTTFVPAHNNLGVVLMERREYGEARRVFQLAFALDSGRSDEIRENLRLAIAKSQNPGYSEENNNTLRLVRRGAGEFLLLSTP